MSESTSINQPPHDGIGHLRNRDRRQPQTTASVQSPGPDLGHAAASPSLSETPSEEDYDENIRPSIVNALDAQRLHRHGRKEPLSDMQNAKASYSTAQNFAGGKGGLSSHVRGSADATQPGRSNSSHKFRDFVFSRQVSTFDAKSEAAMNSPFHGFYTLFWLSVALLICKISANNWRAYGNLLGSSDIMRTMFHKDVIVLLLSDGIMCSLTGVSWLLQRLVFHKFLDWDREGWIIQHIWQAIFIAGTVKWTVYRDWPWTHTVFFVLHALVMLMKQHSYAFYNGHLATIYHKRQLLLSKLQKLDFIECTQASSPTIPTIDNPQSTTDSAYGCTSEGDDNRRHADLGEIMNLIESRKSLDHDQIYLFERVIKAEANTLADQLQGTASQASGSYPHNLTFIAHYSWIPLPTVVYELEYPRSEKIDWAYVAEKVAAMVGIIFVMIQVSQYYIYPVVLVTIEMRENNMPLLSRFMEFPWLLSDLLFPFMMEYLLTWYLIWETVLNILAEVTYFADRHFYDAWWNSVSWDQFARDWNRPVHIFLLRHVYHSSISSLKVNKHTATIITFFISACVHEFIMWCIFKRLRGYLLFLQMCQLPLVRLSQTSWLKDRKLLGNLIFWLGIYTGPSVLCSLYLIL